MMTYRAQAYFSFAKKHYDLISIGAYANRSAKIVQLMSKNHLKVLAVTSQIKQVQPSLAPTTIPPLLTLNQRNQRFADIQEGVYLQRIIPEENTVILKNGQTYTYQGLIYSGAPRQWKDLSFYPQLDKHIKLEDSFAYADDLYGNYERIYNRRMGTIVITLPKSKNFSYENLFMFHLLSKMKNSQKTWQKQLNSLKMIILNEGDSIDPFNKEANMYIQALIKHHNIQHIKNAKFNIDYNHKSITVQNHPLILYASIFQYLPYKIPDSFKNSGINIKDFCPQTTRHKKYSNILAINNLQRTTPTIKAVQQLISVSAYNMFYQLMGLNKAKVAKSRGFSQYDIWIEENKVFRVAYDFDKYLGDKLTFDSNQKIQFSLIDKSRSFFRALSSRVFGYPSLFNLVNGDLEKLSLWDKTKIINLKKEASQMNK